MRSVVLVLALVGAGCLGFVPTQEAPASPGSPGAGNGSPTSSPAPPTISPPLTEESVRWQLATWTQNGLLDGFPEASPGGGYEVNVHTLDDGIAWGASAPENEVLDEVTWWPLGSAGLRAPEGMVWFRLQPGAGLAVVASDDHRDEIGPLFGAWARNTTTAGEVVRERWTERLLASEEVLRTERGPQGTATQYGYQLEVHGPFRLAALRDEVRAAGEADCVFESAASAWCFQTSPVHAVAVRTEARDPPRGLALVVDANETVTFQRVGDTLVTDDEMRALARDVFIDLGLGEPTFDGWSLREFRPD